MPKKLGRRMPTLRRISLALRALSKDSQTDAVSRNGDVALLLELVQRPAARYKIDPARSESGFVPRTPHCLAQANRQRLHECPDSRGLGSCLGSVHASQALPAILQKDAWSLNRRTPDFQAMARGLCGRFFRGLVVSLGHIAKSVRPFGIAPSLLRKT
jgi:hypothetical protein